MISSSKIAQPMHCAAFRTVGPQEPRCPSGALISTIAGTRASAPISAATPSMALPTSPPRTIARNASGSESAGTRYVPATSTSSETPRLPQRRPWSTRPSTRSRGGTGSIPQAGVSSIVCRSSLRRHYPDQVSGCVLSPVGRAPRFAATLNERSGAPRGRPRIVPPPQTGRRDPATPAGARRRPE